MAPIYTHSTHPTTPPHRDQSPPPHTPPQELAVASREAEALLRSISESTAVAEKEKAKVAVIVGEVSSKAAEIAAVKVGGAPWGGEEWCGGGGLKIARHQNAIDQANRPISTSARTRHPQSIPPTTATTTATKHRHATRNPIPCTAG